MDPSTTLILSLMVVCGSLLLLASTIGRVPHSGGRILRQSLESRASIDEFLRSKGGDVNARQYYVLREQAVSCLKHRFRGRFDQAILRFDETPILEMLIERKYPACHLPIKGRPEDFFQAGLYSLALASMGVDCKSAFLLLIYCRQRDASSCAKRFSPSECAVCSRSRTFRKKYSSTDVLRALCRLDEFWYGGRQPRASPNSGKCAGCPFRERRYCKYSVA